MKDERDQSRSIAATEVPLPPERAFVVQLRQPTAPTGELFVGRIEHIASGTVFRFGSAEELTAFIARICDPGFQSDEPRSPGTRPAHTTRGR